MRARGVSSSGGRASGRARGASRNDAVSRPKREPVVRAPLRDRPLFTGDPGGTAPGFQDGRYHVAQSWRASAPNAAASGKVRESRTRMRRTDEVTCAATSSRRSRSVSIWSRRPSADATSAARKRGEANAESPRTTTAACGDRCLIARISRSSAPRRTSKHRGSAARGTRRTSRDLPEARVCGGGEGMSMEGERLAGAQPT